MLIQVFSQVLSEMSIEMLNRMLSQAHIQVLSEKWNLGIVSDAEYDTGGVGEG